MFGKVRVIGLIAGFIMAAVSVAQIPANAPAGSTGLCRDGSYWTGATKTGACRGHKGVQDWYGGTSSTNDASTASPPATVTPSATVAAPVAPAASTPAPAAAAAKTGNTPAITAAPGGGAGQVWVNTASRVYHCPSDRWYGKTKSGEYMSEADAIAKGNRADHGKACQK
jgi:hypothetical protein